MGVFTKLCMSLVVLVVAVFGSTVISEKLCFPKDFVWGVATAAFQVEGAWNVSGKGESIWDHYTHKFPERVFDHRNADIADDSYHKFREDVRLLKQLGVQFYRFSISWPRILPTGNSNNINEEGLKYYSDLINELLAHNIVPLVTMYHWDLPQPLQELGGWTNPIMADYYLDYAKVLFDEYGDRVKSWITFNEPLTFCHDGYGGGDAPGRESSGMEDYMCGHNVLRAHGMAFRLFEKKFENKTGVSLGITLDFAWIEPSTTSQDDQRAAETVRQFTFGWFAHPIFSKLGDYPHVMRHRIDEISRRQHFPRSRLPTFTKDEVEMIRGSAHFLGMNHYTTRMASKGNGRVHLQPSFENDHGANVYQKPEWPKSQSSWLRVVPWGFRKALNWVRKSYSNPFVIITENGISTESGIQDTKRVNYIDAYLRSLHAAIHVDGCNVVGYTHWSLMDNFEWMRGFSERFGLHEVDFTKPHRPRKPRLSASYYSKIIQTNCIQPHENNSVY